MANKGAKGVSPFLLQYVRGLPRPIIRGAVDAYFRRIILDCLRTRHVTFVFLQSAIHKLPVNSNLTLPLLLPVISRLPPPLRS